LTMQTPALSCLASAIRTRSTDGFARTGVLSVLLVLLLSLFASPGAAADVTLMAANDSARQPTLQQRRSAARSAEVQKLQRTCRAIAAKHRTFRTQKCVVDDRLDSRTNLCHPRHARYQSYLRWDMAAGRCKPRHRFDGGSCAGGKRRYNAGKHHAQSAVQSARMFARAPERAKRELDICRRALDKLRRYGAAERSTRKRDCLQAQALKRRDLIQAYCR